MSEPGGGGGIVANADDVTTYEATTGAPTYACPPQDVLAAAQRLAGVVRRTPVMTCRSFDRRAGRRVYFKCENLQTVGAFKYRGASNAVLMLPAERAAAGVATHSSGNHAQALARAAAERGIPAYIVMPRTAAAVKRQAVADYGGRITLCEPSQQAREAAVAAVVAATGATLISPFDHPDVIAGQGTAARELLEEVPELQAIVAPIGGGGLISGCVLAAWGWSRPVRIIGAEPAGAGSGASASPASTRSSSSPSRLSRSKAAGRWLPQTQPQSIADGLLTSTGRLTWPFIRDGVERIITVSDEEIRSTMRFIWERMKLIVEPSGAVAAAAVLADAFRALDGLEAVGVILSGGNVDLDRLYW